MSFTEKVDVLDLLINILREHEEKMDEFVERLEIVTEVLAKKHPDTVLSKLPDIEG